MQLQWLQELKDEYFFVRKENTKTKWTNSKNFFMRNLGKDEACLELIDEDIKFSSKLNILIDDNIKKNNLKTNDIKKGILALKLHISKNNVRTNFLIIFPLIFTLILIFEKLELLKIILPEPYNLIIITFCGFLMLLVLSERIKLTSHKHSLEEILLYLEEKV